ncbi:MAG: inorganic phosphate transporter [Alphaproteobacteria bacterium]|nr:inorganic phosphate transporter [Alphaproteobacteria bacterium]
MSEISKNPEHRYVSDLRRLDTSQTVVARSLGSFLPISFAALFLAVVAFFAATTFGIAREGSLLIVCAAIFGGYMALNIGANDVANNMGPAVGGRVLTIATAIIIAAVCEAAGALIAGGDVVNTVSKGIIAPGGAISVKEFQYLMLSAVFAAALWINIATALGAPVSTTHSIIGGVLGGGIAASGLGLVNWPTMGQIAASWVISPIAGGVIAAMLLAFIKAKILYAPKRLEAAAFWVPLLIALMASAFTAYMTMKGLKNVWTAGVLEITIVSVAAFLIAWLASRPYVAAKISRLADRRSHINTLFDLPLIIGVGLLSFAHGANDVANAVGPLAAIVSTSDAQHGIAAKVTIPFWVMIVGALGISIGLATFGPKLIRVVGEQITRLNSPRAYCVALSAAITVLVATSLGLPVSSTHIAVGAVFGVGFLREHTENPNRRKLRPGHKLNATAAEAFNSRYVKRSRYLVRRRFLWSIAAAWVITVPATALLAGLLYVLLQLL